MLCGCTEPDDPPPKGSATVVEIGDIVPDDKLGIVSGETLAAGADRLPNDREADLGLEAFRVAVLVLACGSSAPRAGPVLRRREFRPRWLR
jgi:hypothetical protein